MPRTTQVVGLALIAVGAIAYFATGRESWTALLPAVIGLTLLVLGVLADRGESSRHFMHAAMVVALLGAAGTMSRAIEVADEGGGASIASAITWVICVVYLVLGIRSFVEARRSA